MKWRWIPRPLTGTRSRHEFRHYQAAIAPRKQYRRQRWLFSAGRTALLSMQLKLYSEHRFSIIFLF
jgi:hypothetical protein